MKFSKQPTTHNEEDKENENALSSVTHKGFS
jgi:hypothetical protein